jgi:hypothetical protein
MMHRDLQVILKEYRAIGYDLQVELNASVQALQTEYDRLTANLQVCELPQTELETDFDYEELLDMPFEILTNTQWNLIKGYKPVSEVEEFVAA